MKAKIIAGLVQHSCVDDPAENIAKTIESVKDAAKRGASLIVLQELHRTLYFCQNEDVRNFDLAETIPGPTTDLYSGLAKELKTVLVVSVFEKRTVGLYHNTAVVIERDGSIAGRYRKMHVPDDPQFYEKFYFTPGDEDFTPVQTSAGRLGVQICWDQWYPEAARILALKGAEVLVYPTAIGWTMQDSNDEKKRQFDSWLTIQKAHSIANALPLICANRVGLEYNPLYRADTPPYPPLNKGGIWGGEKFEVSPGIQFWGNSFICGPQGEYLAMAANNRDDVIIAEIDPARTDDTRRIWPFFRDRRIDHYGDILKRFCDDQDGRSAEACKDVPATADDQDGRSDALSLSKGAGACKDAPATAD